MNSYPQRASDLTICRYYGEDSLKLEQEGVELNMCKALEELEKIC